MGSDEQNSPADPRAALAAWYLRPGLRVLILTPMTEVLAFFVLLLLMRGAFEDPSANLKVSTAAVLALAPPPVNRVENAAEDYAMAFKLMTYQTILPQNLQPGLYVGQPDVLEEPSIKGYLAANGPTRLALLAGSKKAKCNFGLNYALGLNIPLPHLSKLRECARMLALDARVKAHNGDHAGAAESIAAIYKLAQHAGSDQLAIPQMVMLADVGIADWSLDTILCCDAPSRPEDLAAYRRALWKDRHGMAQFSRCVRGDTQADLMYMDTLATTTSTTGAIGPVSGLMDSKFYAVLFYSADRECLKAVTEKFCAMEQTGAVMDSAEIQQFIAAHQAGPALMTRMIAPMYGHYAIDVLKNEERCLLTEAALAFLQFRAKYGRDVGKLDELVPEFLAAVPTDPFHHHPLRVTVSALHPSEESKKWQRTIFSDMPVIRIYSDGENGIDEQGVGNEGSPLDDPCVILAPIGFKRATGLAPAPQANSKAGK